MGALGYYSYYPGDLRASIKTTTDKTKSQTVQYTTIVSTPKNNGNTVNIYTNTSRLLLNGKNTEQFVYPDINKSHKIISREILTVQNLDLKN